MTPEEMLDVLRWFWQDSRSSILYVLWLIQTMYMTGMIVK